MKTTNGNVDVTALMDYSDEHGDGESEWVLLSSDANISGKLVNGLE